MGAIRVAPADLSRFSATCLERVGVPPADAALAATVLVHADLRGVASHGVVFLPTYIRRIRDGEINPAAEIRVISERSATALLDGGNGLGQVVAARAMDIAIAKAEQYGTGVVGVRRSNHFGMAAFFALRAAARGMIGRISTVSNVSSMVPWGGLDVFIGNNPTAVAVPAATVPPVVFDAAWSVAARGKIHDAKRRGEPIPRDWALDAEGKPTTDPDAALAGILCPAGGHKGSGMAFMTSLLAGVLTGARIGKQVNNTDVGHLVEALDVSAFRDAESFCRDVDAAVREVHTSRPAAGTARPRVPGERGAAIEAERRENGIPLEAETQRLLTILGAALDVSFP